MLGQSWNQGFHSGGRGSCRAAQLPSINPNVTESLVADGTCLGLVSASLPHVGPDWLAMRCVPRTSRLPESGGRPEWEMT